ALPIFQIPPIVAPIDGDQQRALGGGVGLESASDSLAFLPNRRVASTSNGAASSCSVRPKYTTGGPAGRIVSTVDEPLTRSGTVEEPGHGEPPVDRADDLAAVRDEQHSGLNLGQPHDDITHARVVLQPRQAGQGDPRLGGRPGRSP